MTKNQIKKRTLFLTWFSQHRTKIMKKQSLFLVLFTYFAMSFLLTQTFLISFKGRVFTEISLVAKALSGSNCFS